MLIDIPPRFFHTPQTECDLEGCSIVDLYYDKISYASNTETEKQNTLKMDFFIKPVCNNANINSNDNASNILYYIIHDKTVKVPQVQQTQQPNAFIHKPDITGALCLTNTSNNWMESFDRPIKNNDNISSLMATGMINSSPKSSNNSNNMQNISDRLFCNICHSKFSKRCDYDKHYRDKHPYENIVYICSICRYQEKDFNKFRNHYYRHFNVGGLRCFLCPNYRFTQKEHLFDHKNIFHNDTPLESVFISKNKNEKSANKIDKTVCEYDSYNLHCFMCKMNFIKKDEYDEHWKNTHSTYNLFYECSLCSRSYKLFGNFQSHACTMLNQKNKYKYKNKTNNTNDYFKSDSLERESVNNGDNEGLSMKQFEDHGFVNVKDSTLPCTMKEFGDWELFFNDFNYGNNSNNNTDSNEALKEDYDFPINVNDDCDLFETIRYSLDILPDNSTSSNNDRNTPSDSTVNKSVSSISTNSKNILNSDVTDDLLTHLISDNVVEDFITTNSVKPSIELNESNILNDSVKKLQSEKEIESTINLNELNINKTNNKELLLMCFVCKINFTDRNNLLEHIGSDHPSWYEIYKCRDCYFTSYDYEKYSQHSCYVYIFSKRINRMRFSCKTSNTFSKHTLEDYEKRSGWTSNGFYCKCCDKKFPCKDLYDSHYKEVHKSIVTMYTCSWCTTRHFTNYESFRSHCNNHYSSGKYLCSYCGKSFSKLSKLSVHERVVHHEDDTSTINSMSPRSTISYSSQLSVSSGISSDYEHTEFDSNGCCEKDKSNWFMETESIEDNSKMNDRINNENVNVWNHPTLLYDFEGDNTFPKSSSNKDYNINSPESGIDCINSPFSDFKSSPDYQNDFQNSPESAVYCQSPCNQCEKSFNQQENLITNLHKTKCEMDDCHFDKSMNQNHSLANHESDKLPYKLKVHEQPFTRLSSEALPTIVNVKRKKEYSELGASAKRERLELNRDNSNTWSQETEENGVNRSSPELLSEYNIENCIQSVINTSEDFEHSVIYNEYNKGINIKTSNKYDILSCNLNNNKDINRQLLWTSHTNAKQMSNKQNDKMDKTDETQSIFIDKEHIDKTLTSLEQQPLISLLEGNKIMGDEDLNNVLAVNNNDNTNDYKTENIIISDQCNNNNIYNKSTQTSLPPSYGDQHNNNRKQSKIINHLSAAVQSSQDGATNKFEDQKVLLIAMNPMEKQTTTQQLNNVQLITENSSDCVIYKAYDQSVLQSVPGETHIQHPVLFDGKNIVYTGVQQPVNYLPSVLMINIIISTSSAVSNANANDFKHDNTLTNLHSITTLPKNNTVTVVHEQTSLRGFRRRPKISKQQNDITKEMMDSDL